MPNLKDQAIKSALNQDWETAIDLNLEILIDNENDIATLNRLGFAYLQNGNFQEATQAYQKVVSIDKFNPIATKALKKLSQNPQKPHSRPKAVNTCFIEEPGKTKTVQLVRLGNANTINHLSVGEPVNLHYKKRRITIETEDKQIVGCLPDDLSFKLGRLLSLGYTYQAFVKSTDPQRICVFIKETSRAEAGQNLPSFSSSASVLTSIPGTKIDNIPVDVTPTGEDEND